MKKQILFALFAFAAGNLFAAVAPTREEGRTFLNEVSKQRALTDAQKPELLDGQQGPAYSYLVPKQPVDLIKHTETGILPNRR